MKRLSVLLTVFAVLLCMIPLAPSVYAAEYIRELGLSVEFPEGYEVVTREMVENGYSTEYQTNEEILSQWKSSTIYANAFADMGQADILITMQKEFYSDFSSLNDEELETLLLEDFLPFYKANGVEVTKWDVIRTEETAFLCMQFSNTNFQNMFENAHTLQYYTIRNNYAYGFIYHSYYTDITTYHEALMQLIIESVQFIDVPSSTYTAKSGATFTVPEGWIQHDLDEGVDYQDVEFVPSPANDQHITFGCRDVWSELPVSQQQQTPREQYNHKVLSNDDVRKMLTEDGITIERFAKKAIADDIYYCAEGMISSATDIETYVILHLENGWMYRFQLTVPEHYIRLYDLEDFARTAQYPAPAVTTTTPTVAATKATTVKTTVTAAAPTTNVPDSVPANTYTILLIAGITVAVIVILVLGIRLTRRPAKRVETSDVSEQFPAPPAVRFCRYCGKELPKDSTFCPFCGKPLGE